MGEHASRGDFAVEKCTAAVTVRLTEEARKHLSACALIAGMSSGEYARVLLLDHLYGRLARYHGCTGARSEGPIGELG